MTRRARHLNPGHAGATVALDARFITGVANGASLSTWYDRSSSGNNAVHVPAGTDPVYNTGVFNGLPYVSLNGSNCLQGNFTSGSTAPLTAMTVCSSTITNPANGRLLVVYRVNGLDDYNSIQSAILFAAGASSAVMLTYRNLTSLGTYAISTGTPFQATTQWVSGNNWYGRKAGVQQATNTQSGNFDTQKYRIGSHYFNDTSLGEYWVGKVAQVTIFSGLMSNEVRNRLEQAASYSFKLSWK